MGERCRFDSGRDYQGNVKERIVETLVWLIVLAAVAYGGWWVYKKYVKKDDGGSTPAAE